MDNMKKTLMDLTRKVTKTSGEVIKTTKLSLSLSTEEESLRAIYTDIGKKVHEIYMYGGTLGKFFDEKYKDIQIAEQKIDALKEEIDKVKGTKTCPKCGRTVEPSEFCPKCGARLDASLPDTTVSEAVAKAKDLPAPDILCPPAPPATLCRVCGVENEPGTKFCISCGRLCQ